MRNQLKDRIINGVLILLFLAIITASAYGLLKIMTQWTVKGLG